MKTIIPVAQGKTVTEGLESLSILVTVVYHEWIQLIIGYPASRVSGRGPAGLGKPKLLLSSTNPKNPSEDAAASMCPSHRDIEFLNLTRFKKCTHRRLSAGSGCSLA